MRVPISKGVPLLFRNRKQYSQTRSKWSEWGPVEDRKCTPHFNHDLRRNGFQVLWNEQVSYLQDLPWSQYSKHESCTLSGSAESLRHDGLHRQQNVQILIALLDLLIGVQKTSLNASGLLIAERESEHNTFSELMQIKITHVSPT